MEVAPLDAEESTPLFFKHYFPLLRGGWFFTPDLVVIDCMTIRLKGISRFMRYLQSQIEMEDPTEDQIVRRSAHELDAKSARCFSEAR